VNKQQQQKRKKKVEYSITINKELERRKLSCRARVPTLRNRSIDESVVLEPAGGQSDDRSALGGKEVREADVVCDEGGDDAQGATGGLYAGGREGVSASFRSIRVRKYALCNTAELGRAKEEEGDGEEAEERDEGDGFAEGGDAGGKDKGRLAIVVRAGNGSEGREGE
jgi:hypothetical protein